MDEAGRHHPLRWGKEAVTTPWRSVQDAKKANGTVAWQALPCSDTKFLDTGTDPVSCMAFSGTRAQSDVYLMDAGRR